MIPASDKYEQPPLPLRWIFVSWIGIGFTVAVFVVLGMATRGDPTQFVERHFGDPALFAFLLYTAGLLAALLVLCRLFQ